MVCVWVGNSGGLAGGLTACVQSALKQMDMHVATSSDVGTATRSRRCVAYCSTVCFMSGMLGAVMYWSVYFCGETPSGWWVLLFLARWQQHRENDHAELWHHL